MLKLKYLLTGVATGNLAKLLVGILTDGESAKYVSESIKFIYCLSYFRVNGCI
jgi:hypothetical protein